MMDAIEMLVDAAEGAPVKLPPAVERAVGPLCVPVGRWTYANFVESLDGVVTLGVPPHALGGTISGHDARDRALMGVLRAMADAVVVGAGTARVVSPTHLWTAGAIFPDFAHEFDKLRASEGRAGQPLNVIVSASGDLDATRRVFSSGEVDALVLTTAAGAERFTRRRPGPRTSIRVVAGEGETIGASTIVDAALEASGGSRVLIEGGPHLLGGLVAGRMMDDLFLTLSPLIAGRDSRGGSRLALVEGHEFAPAAPVWTRLVSMRRAGSHIYLRYAMRRDRS